MSVGAYDRVRVRRQLQLLEQVVATSDLDAEGVLTIQVGATETNDPGGVIVLVEGGSVVSGIRVMEGDVEVTDTFLAGMFLVIIGEGAGILLAHEDAGVTTAARRFACVPSSQDVGVDARQIILRYSTTASRWLVPDWGYYAAAEAGDWNPVPTSTTAAIDQLADRTPIKTTSSYTSTSGVAHVLWSYSLAEDEVIGGRLEITAKFTSGGVTSRSRGFIDFGASRSVGGVAAVTNNNSLENGTLAAGTISIDTDGANLVRVNITYSVNGTVDYVTRLHFDAL